MKCGKLLSALLAAVLLFGRLPNSVHAAENEAPISSIMVPLFSPGCMQHGMTSAGVRKWRF